MIITFLEHKKHWNYTLQQDVHNMNEKAEYSLDAAKLVKNKLINFLASK